MATENIRRMRFPIQTPLFISLDPPAPHTPSTYLIFSSAMCFPTNALLSRCLHKTSDSLDSCAVRSWGERERDGERKKEDRERKEREIEEIEKEIEEKERKK